MIDLIHQYKWYSNSSYADDATLYSNANDLPSVELELLISATKLFRWFKNKHFKGNTGNFHNLLSTKKPDIVSINSMHLTASSHKKLLGVRVNLEVKF